MHTVVLLAHALNVAERLGYQIRQEWLDGHSGGRCELKGRKILFLDLSISPQEQLELMLLVLRGEPEAADLQMPSQLKELLRVRKSA